jgi:acyl carrier protein
MNTMENKFLELFADALEMDASELSLSMKLEELENWDSMAALGVIAFSDAEYSKTITGDQLDLFGSVSDIYLALTSK